MNVLFINESLGGGGAERQLTLIAGGFGAAGHNVTLATWASAQVADAYPLSAAVQRLHLRRWEIAGGMLSRIMTHLQAFVRLLALIRRIRPAILISFSDASNFLTVVAGSLFGIPTVVSIRVDPEPLLREKPHWRRPAVWAYSRADAVVVQTRAAARWVEANCARTAIVIPNILRPLPPAADDAQRLPIVVAVGRLDAQKGHDVLIRAFANAHEAYPEWRLLIFGEGPERARLAALASELRVERSVELRGFASNIEAELDQARVFAMASRFEGFPNALIEAMGMGLPCISTDCHFGPAEIVNDGDNGLLVAVDDLEGLSSGLSRLMRDTTLRQRLSAKAVEIRGQYGVERIMGLWAEAVRRAQQGQHHVC